jgi:hypothetical protein
MRHYVGGVYLPTFRRNTLSSGYVEGSMLPSPFRVTAPTSNKPGDVRINVTLRRVRVTTVALEKQ